MREFGRRKECKNIEGGIESSALKGIGVQEAINMAIKIVLFPVSPLYDSVQKVREEK